MATDKDRITVYLPSELRERISQLAEQDKRSVSATIEILLLKAIEAMDKEQQKKSQELGQLDSNEAVALLALLQGFDRNSTAFDRLNLKLKPIQQTHPN